MSLELTSPAFDSGQSIPIEYTCDGENISPPLILKGVPEEADSLVLICDDPDSPPDLHGPFTHWVLYNLPADLEEIPEGFSPKGGRSKEGRVGVNSFGNSSYMGPCPPGAKAHRYVFRVYALKGRPELTSGANREQLLQSIKDHVLDQAVHLGQYASRKRSG